MHEEWSEKEGELEDLVLSFEGREIEYQGRSGIIMYIDAGNDLVGVAFEDCREESIHFNKLC